MPTHNRLHKIELLAPARDADTGIEAIKHGADAVYIGGPNFGARSAAGNSVDDIARLCNFAHLYGARIYVTLNTILWTANSKPPRNWYGNSTMRELTPLLCRTRHCYK